MSSHMIDPTAGPINRAATFHPVHNENEHPAIEVAGVLVFAYLDAEGTLRVTVDTESADHSLFPPDHWGGIPVQVNVNTGSVFDDVVN